MKLVAYLRGKGRGLDAQRDAIHEWAGANAHEVVAYATDTSQDVGPDELSSRRGLHVALAAIQAHEADGLVVESLFRLAGRLPTQEAILAVVWCAGGRVFTTEAGEEAQESPGSRERAGMRDMAEALGVLQRAAARERLQAGRQRKAAQGAARERPGGRTRKH